MEARRVGSSLRMNMATTLVLCLLANTLQAQFSSSGGHRAGATSHAASSENFIVFASSPEWAAHVAREAEKQRRDLAIYWLGAELPPWPQRCPLHVHSGPQMGASGETRFMLLNNSPSSWTAGNWSMVVQGTPTRVLDSVLPHEITHTIFATHFGPLGKYVPRWADEGACTTVEHEAEKNKHRQLVLQFLKTGKGLSFNTMFSLKEYPDPILPLYAQGHSAVQFLIDQGGPRRFIQFLEQGMQTEQWERALREKYAYQTLGEFQTLWNKWLADGSPEDLLAYAPGLRAAGEIQLATAASEARPSSRDLARVVDAGFDLNPAEALPPPGTQLTLPGDSSDNNTGATAANSYAPTNDPLALAEFTFASRSVTLPDIIDIPPVAPAAPALDTPAEAWSPPTEEKGWYKRPLRAIAEPISANSPERLSAPSNSLPPTERSPTQGIGPLRQTRPIPAQSNGIRVLDWGSRGTVSGIELR